MIKKGNMLLSIVYYGKWSYPNNNDVLYPGFLNLTLYDGREKKNEGVYCSLYLVHKYTELLNNMTLKCRFVDLQNK